MFLINECNLGGKIERKKKGKKRRDIINDIINLKNGCVFLYWVEKISFKSCL